MKKEDIIEAGIQYTMSTRPMCIGGDDFYEMSRELNRNKAFETGAEFGSTEQKKIDIEKACEWIKDNLNCDVESFVQIMSDFEKYMQSDD